MKQISNGCGTVPAQISHIAGSCDLVDLSVLGLECVLQCKFGDLFFLVLLYVRFTDTFHFFQCSIFLYMDLSL